MTKRDFFILLIKVFGLYSVVVSLFSILPSSLSFASYGLETVSIIWVILSIVIMIGLFTLLVLKSDKVVSVLDLDKGFDEDRIEINNLKAADIIKIGTFIVGAILILNNIPYLLSHSFFAFKSTIIGMEYKSQSDFNFAVSAIKIVIGYLLLTNYDFVANKLNIRSEEKK